MFGVIGMLNLKQKLSKFVTKSLFDVIYNIITIFVT